MAPSDDDIREADVYLLARMSSEIFDRADAVVASALDVSPVAMRMQLQARAIADYVASGADTRAAVDTLLSEPVVPQFREYAYTRNAPLRNNWIAATQGDIYGSDYTPRTVADLIGLWANTPTEVVYHSGSVDCRRPRFSLTFRCYLPKSAAREGKWAPFPITVVDD